MLPSADLPFLATQEFCPSPLLKDLAVATLASWRETGPTGKRLWGLCGQEWFTLFKQEGSSTSGSAAVFF